MLTLSVVLAWVLLQVPLVLCSATCKQSVDSALLMARHACHDTDSPRHQHRCLRDRSHDHTRHGTPERQAPEPGGEHVLVQLPTVTQIVTVTLPPHGRATALLLSTQIDEACGVNAPHTRAPALDPPPPADATTLSDRLLV